MKLKLLYLSLCGILFSINIYSQNKAKLSAFTNQYLLASKDIKTLKQQQYISALIKVNDKIDVQKLNKLGVIVGTKAGNVWTAKIPNDKFQDFISIEGIEYIQMDEPIHPNLEMARKTTHADSVQHGIDLPLAYTGKNVVVGIIDVGFDYDHPTFYDTLGHKYRIKRIWEQKTNGTPPAGYSYGNEITDTLIMKTSETDDNTSIHGSHVAGIAAGSGFGSLSNSKYRGFAFESDIVLVGITPKQSQWTGGGLTDIIDGMNYIYQYAASQGKPAVVNLSWGCTIGSNDGTSLFSQACDNLTGAGKIFVIAAGNNGTDKIHLQKDFTPNDSVIKSFISFDNLLTKKTTWMDIWGDSAKTFTVELSLYSNNTVKGNSIRFTCNNQMTVDTFIIGSANDTCFIKATTTPSELNNKSHAFFDIYNNSSDNLCVEVTDTVGRVNMWLGYVLGSHGYYGAFNSNGTSWATDGNADMTLGEMASTKSAITVGAYSSKIDWTDINGGSWSYTGYALNNRIAPFSSHGPTVDNRMKPEITAPGLTIASAVNSYDTSFSSYGTNSTFILSKYTNPSTSHDYYYAEASGTSMAAPATSGIIALMLQIKPDLTPQEVKNILINTAIKDNYTTQTPNQNLWGAGKINAYAAVKNTIKLSGIKQNSFSNSINHAIYPNPAKTEFTLEITSKTAEEQNIELYNILGNLIYSKRWNTTQGQNKTLVKIPDNTPSGTYILKISSPQGNSINKVLIE